MTTHAQVQVGTHPGPMLWQRELLHLTLLFMEAAWVILLFLALAPGANLLPSGNAALFVIANMLSAMLLVRFATVRQMPYQVSRWLVLAGLVIAVLFTLVAVLPPGGVGSHTPLLLGALSKTTFGLIPTAMISIVAVIFLWFRGIQIATTLVTPVRASFGFRLGILVIIFMALIPDAHFQATLISVLPLFFFAGLMASSLARSASLKINRDAQRLSFGRQWLGFTGVIGLLVSAVGFLIALLLAGYGADGASRILQGMGDAAFALLLIILTPIIAVLEWLLRPLAGALQTLLEKLSNSPLTKQLNSQQSATPVQNLQQFAAILNVLKWTCLGAVVLAVVIVLFAMLRRQSLGEGDRGEEHEKLDGESLSDGLRGWLRRLGELPNPLARFGRPQQTEAMTIRRLYARLLARATELGYPRDTAQTPYEYEAQLCEAFPGFTGEAALITRAYVHVHYGEVPEEADDLSAVRSAVERMIASRSES